MIYTLFTKVQKTHSLRNDTWPLYYYTNKSTSNGGFYSNSLFIILYKILFFYGTFDINNGHVRRNVILNGDIIRLESLSGLVSTQNNVSRYVSVIHINIMSWHKTTLQ